MIDMSDVMAGVKLSCNHDARVKVNVGISLFAAAVFGLRMPLSFAFLQSRCKQDHNLCAVCVSEAEVALLSVYSNA